MTGRVGIRDVAREAGVSLTTVSHALSGRGKVSAETRSRVEQIARELGYNPNRVATALRRRRSDMIGLVSDEIATTPFAGRIVLGAQDAASAAGMALMVVNSNRNPAVEARQLEVLRAQQVDAVLYASMFHREVEAPVFGGPVILVNAESDTGAASIAPDEYRIGVDATRLLLDAGHRRIVHLTIDEPGLGVDGRMGGHQDTMRAAGLATHIVRVPGPADATAGRAALDQAFLEDESLSAAFVFNDPMAMGVYQAAGRRGLRVPHDLSLVGVDDLELIAAQLLPGLTTFQLPHYEMGRWAVASAVDLLEAPDTPVRSVSLLCELIVRESVRARG